MKRTARWISGLLAALMVGGAFVPASFAAPVDRSAPREGVEITHHEGGPDYYDRTVNTFRYDFEVASIGRYGGDPAVAFRNAGSALLDGGRLSAAEGKTVYFGSGYSLGDDYGLEDGYLVFDLSLDGGAVELGVRTSEVTAVPTDRGVWIKFDGSDALTVTEPECGLSVKVPLSAELSGGIRRVEVADRGEALTVSVDGTVILSVDYGKDGHLTVKDGGGQTVTDIASRIYPTGYFTIGVNAGAAIDNVAYTYVSYERKIEKAEGFREMDYSTWVATDDLDRHVATPEEAGAPRAERYVGLFYFLCWVGAAQRVQDNTDIYLKGGIDGVKDYFEARKGGEAYWAEPYFGYYLNTDTWVYRKHGYMLEQAGVDFIYLDVSNAQVFIEGHTALFDTWLEMRREGMHTPQIIFFNGDDPKTFASNMKTLYTTVYSPDNWEKYEELFFQWKGKPLVLGNLDGVESSLRRKISEQFTVRRSWAWMDKDNAWPWLQEYILKGDRAKLVNGGFGRDKDGRIEALSVALGHHPTMSKGRSFVNGKEPNNGLRDFEFSSIERAGQGLCFEAQFRAMGILEREHVPAEDPFIMMITGWNEWIAGCYYEDHRKPFANGTADFAYVDQFNAEFSRDGEPMRNKDGYGFGDNYYYQMVDYIRRFKGMNPTPKADGQGTVDVYDPMSFGKIELEYRDAVYDVELRNQPCYDRKLRYVNGTGRNDFDYAKVSQDGAYLYFLVKCVDDIIVDDGANFMNLYLNVDGDDTNGFMGYDYILNRDRDSFVVTVEKIVGVENQEFQTEVVGGAYYAIDGAFMTVQVSKELLDVEGTLGRMVFKWADNSIEKADPMGFMDLGDTAPDSRFGFLYLCDSCSDEVSFVPPVPAEKGTATSTRKSVEMPDNRVEIPYTDVTIDERHDLKGAKAGMNMTETSLMERFEFKPGTTSSQGVVKRGPEGLFVRMNGFSDLRSFNDVIGDYRMSVKWRSADTNMAAIFLRGEMPGAFVPINHANGDHPTTFHYFEWDWYAENHGFRSGSSGMGGSGIGLFFTEQGLKLSVKCYAEDGLTVASRYVTVPYVEAINPTKEWVQVDCVDEKQVLTISLNGQVTCRVRMENPGVVYESDGTGQPYFGKVTVENADKKVLLTVNNSRLNARGSQIALATRAATADFADLSVQYSEVKIDNREVKSLEGEAVEHEFVPDVRLLNTLGGLAVPEEDTTGAESESTAVPDGQADTEAESEAPRKKGCRSAFGSLGSGAVLGAVLLGAAVMIRRKREDDPR